MLVNYVVGRAVYETAVWRNRVTALLEISESFQIEGELNLDCLIIGKKMKTKVYQGHASG